MISKFRKLREGGVNNYNRSKNVEQEKRQLCDFLLYKINLTKDFFYFFTGNTFSLKSLPGESN
jgi:hypothetical protein